MRPRPGNSRESSRRHRYLLFHKPYGVLSQFTDSSENPRPTLKNFITVPGVYAVGRLDFDSEGLVLLSSDGAFQHRMADPRYGHSRTYWAQVEGTPTDAALEPLRKGVVIQGIQTRPAAARVLSQEPPLPPRHPPIRFRKSVPASWIELVLTEGRYRQVRKMTAAAGFPTLRLVRVAIEGLRLEGLAPGEWRDLREEELRALRARS